MNINGIFSQQPKLNVTKSVKNNADSEKKSNINNKNFDQIIIDVKTNSTIDEQEFVTALKAKVNSETKPEIDVSKLDEIKQRIYSSDYTENPEEVARKMTIGI